MKNILFLGRNSKKTKLINFLKNKNFKISCLNKSITLVKNIKKFDLIILFGYVGNLEKDDLKKCKRPIINLLTSYMPFNTEPNSNIWSFIDNTPIGVTIHEINKSFDNKNIIFQKLIHFDLNKNKSLTLNQFHKVLFIEVENLFIKEFEKIISFKYTTYKPIKVGIPQKIREFPKHLIKNSNDKIIKIKSKYFNHLLKKEKDRLNLINKIENTRKTNNVNWMNLLKIAIKSNPTQTLEVLKKINNDDNKISKLIKKIH